MYFPSIEQSHVFQDTWFGQGFMGGVVSYEDMMRFHHLKKDIIISGKSQYQDIACIKIT